MMEVTMTKNDTSSGDTIKVGILHSLSGTMDKVTENQHVMGR